MGSGSAFLGYDLQHSCGTIRFHIGVADEAVTVHVPTTLLWGERDKALLPALLDGLGRWVPDLQIHRVPQASHWIVHEQPWRVVELIQSLLR